MKQMDSDPDAADCEYKLYGMSHCVADVYARQIVHTRPSPSRDKHPGRDERECVEIRCVCYTSDEGEGQSDTLGGA